MQKSMSALALSVVLLSGCSAVAPIKEVKLPVQQPEIQPVQKPVEVQKVTTNPMQNKMQTIDAQVASQQMFTYQLPIANSTITKREVSGFLDEEKTGKISRVVEGVANTKEHFYFEKGQLVGVKLETTAEGKTSVKEMVFENKKITSLTADGVDDMKNPYLSYLEESEVTDAESILSEFSDKKLNS